MMVIPLEFSLDMNCVCSSKNPFSPLDQMKTKSSEKKSKLLYEVDGGGDSQTQGWHVDRISLLLFFLSKESRPEVLVINLF
jgi:hypothetical protein